MLGDRIKSYRSAKGWTQGVFAEKLDVSIGYISEIETGRRMPSLTTLLSIVDLLECTPNELLGYKSKNGRNSACGCEGVDDTIRATMQMMSAMGPEERFKVFTYAKDQRYLSDYLKRMGEHRGEISLKGDVLVSHKNPESRER